MSVTYEMTKKTYRLEDGIRTSYGITARANEEESREVCTESICDITSDKEALQALVDECNRLELSALHLRDVVEDFLAN